MASGLEVVTVGVHEFRREVLVEVTVRDEDGDLVVRSFPFDPSDDRLVADEPVPADLQPVVAEALSDEGYEYAPESAA